MGLKYILTYLIVNLPYIFEMVMRGGVLVKLHPHIYIKEISIDMRDHCDLTFGDSK